MKFLLILFFSSTLFASQVTHTGITLRYLLVSQDTVKPFELKEYLCIVQHSDEIACGFVEKMDEKGVLIDLEFRAEDVQVGSQVQRSNTRKPCDPDFIFHTEMKKPYSRECTKEEQKKSSGFKVPINRFFSVSFGILSFRLAGERTLGESFSVGLGVSLQQFYESLPSIKAKAAGTGFGGDVFLSFFPMASLENLYAQFSVGYMQGRMTLRSDLNSWSGTVVGLRVGYRILNWQGFGIGFSFNGNHYSFKNAEDPSRTEFLYPGIQIEFGGAF